MIQDKDFHNLKKMQYKYKKEFVEDMLQTLKEMSYKEIALKDFKGNLCVYLPTLTLIDTKIMKKLLSTNNTNKPYGIKAMEEEIDSTLQIENIYSSRESVRKILGGMAPTSEEENRILGMKKGLDFISDLQNKITEKSLHHLYMLCIIDSLEVEDMLPKESYYRNDAVYIVGDKPYHQGLKPELLPEYMKELINFANIKDEIPELIKSCIIHFYFAYLHPYFDGNGRTARLFQLWYLIQQGFPSTLFHAYSSHIMNTKSKYYKSFTLIEENYEISNLIDLTPFILYFNDQVFMKLDDNVIDNPVFEVFIQNLKDGKITEKERDLWNYILSAYSDNPFSTKQLEKDFGNAAYATIRSFVLKFEAIGLLSSQRYGNRVKYIIIT